MPKRGTVWTEDKINRYLKEGRGQGEGSKYAPWLTIRDFPSSGRVSRVHGWTTNRIHHFMSDLETNYFYLLDWSDYITDIREQFPLDREITLRIAETKGIKHPIDTKSQTPVVMTSDFLLSGYRNGKEFVVVRTIKPSDKLDNPRTIAKFEIERAYWEEKGINWGIVTEKEIPKTFVNNVKWVHQALRLDGSHGVDSGNITIYSDRLKRHLLNDKCSMRTILNRLDEETNAPAGTFLFVLKHLIATKEVAIKMNDKFVIKNRPQDMIENIKFAVEEEKTII